MKRQVKLIKRVNIIGAPEDFNPSPLPEPPKISFPRNAAEARLQLENIHREQQAELERFLLI